MQESLHETNASSLKINPPDSSTSLEAIAQSSLTLEVDSTSNGLGLTRFWKRSCEAKYETCMCPIRTGSVASHSILSTSFVHDMEQRSSWQRMEIRRPLNLNLQRTSCPSSQFLGLVSMEEEESSEKEKGPGMMKRKIPLKGKLRSYKIRMYPTAEQTKELKTWFAAGRRAYNKAIQLMENEKHPLNPNTVELRKHIVVNEKLQDVWEADVPTRIRARAVQQAVDAVKINRRKKKRYRMSFRSLKKDLTETLVVEKTCGVSKGPVNEFKASPRSNRWITAHFAPRTKLGKLGGVRLRDKAWLCEKLVKDKSLTEDALLKWEKSAKAFYLIIRVEEMSQRDYDLNWDNKKIVALDPGARNFQTFYSPDGTHGELLTNTKEYMDKKCAKIDKVQAHVAALKAKEDLKHKQRWRKISRRHDLIRKLHYKLKCFRHNAHYAAANFLLRQWDVVMIPKFEVAKMTKNGPRRVMGKKSTREMYNWAHYEFRQRLISKAFKYAGRHVVVVNEPGTSKTCGVCGNWNAGLGGNKVFQCPSCHVELDRDVNGARNNLLAQIG
jgi:putative transposase